MITPAIRTPQSAPRRLRAPATVGAVRRRQSAVPTGSTRARYARMWMAISTPQTPKLAACRVSSGPPPCPTTIIATPLPNKDSVEAISSGASNRSSSRGGPSRRYAVLAV